MAYKIYGKVKAKVLPIAPELSGDGREHYDIIATGATSQGVGRVYSERVDYHSEIYSGFKNLLRAFPGNIVKVSAQVERGLARRLHQQASNHNRQVDRAMKERRALARYNLGRYNSTDQRALFSA